MRCAGRLGRDIAQRRRYRQRIGSRTIAAGRAPCRAGLLALAIAALAAPAASASTYTVDTTADLPDANPADGICSVSTGSPSGCSLRAAVTQAAAHAGADTITLPAGEYLSDDLVHGASATGDLEIDGAGSQTTIIRGSANHGVLRIVDNADNPPMSVTLRGLTLADGHEAQTGGGGLFISGQVGRVDLTDVRIVANATAQTGASGAGAVFHGGGLLLRPTLTAPAAVTIASSTIDGNSTAAGGLGGGLAIDGNVALMLDSSTVSRNDAGAGGGAIATVSGTSTITIQNSTLSSNGISVGGSGGAVLITPFSRLDLRHATIAGNTAPADGQAAGIDFNQTTTVTSVGSIVLRNTTPGASRSCRRGLTSQGGNIFDEASCGPRGADRVGDEALGPLVDNGGATQTMLPPPGGLAVDFAALATCPAVDQRGLLRPFGLACDSGAVEQQTSALQPTPPAVPAPAPQPELGKSFEAGTVSGSVRYKPPGRAAYVALPAGLSLVATGTLIDARDGVVKLIAQEPDGSTQTGRFSQGAFRIAQSATGLVTLTLAGTLRAGSGYRAAAARTKKSKSKRKGRRLFGDAKGRWRTDGRLAAATVRGTVWLTTDTSTTTWVKVTRGVVDVRDKVRGRTHVVRAGKTYTVKQKRRR